MTEFDAPQKAKELLTDAQSGKAITKAYQNLSPEEQRAVFSAMQNKETLRAMGLPELVISGQDSDGDGKQDTLLDVYNQKTGADLYNRPGEKDHSSEALKARSGSIDRSLSGNSVRGEYFSTNWRPSEKFSLSDFSLGELQQYSADLAVRNRLNDEQTNAFRHSLMSAYMSYKYGNAVASTVGTGYEIATGGARTVAEDGQIVASAARHWTGKEKPNDRGVLGTIENSIGVLADNFEDSAIDMHNNRWERELGLRAKASGMPWSQVETMIINQAKRVDLFTGGKMPD